MVKSTMTETCSGVLRSRRNCSNDGAERTCVCVCVCADTAVGWTVFAASDRRKSTRHRPIHVSCPQRLWSTELHATARRHRSVAMRSLRALIDRHLLFEKPYYALYNSPNYTKLSVDPKGAQKSKLATSREYYHYISLYDHYLRTVILLLLVFHHPLTLSL